jgi:hypothetical protein
MCQVVGVDDRVIHRVGRIDGNLTMTERVLNSCADVDGAVEIVPDQEFDLWNRAAEEGIDGGVIDGLVTGNHGLICAGTRSIRVELVQYAGFQIGHAGAENVTGVDICDCGVDIGEESRVSLKIG